MKKVSKVRKIAVAGVHLPRKCGSAAFTSDLLAAIAAAYPQSQCVCISVSGIQEGCVYPNELLAAMRDDHQQAGFER